MPGVDSGHRPMKSTAQAREPGGGPLEETALWLFAVLVVFFLGSGWAPPFGAVFFSLGRVLMAIFGAVLGLAWLGYLLFGKRKKQALVMVLAIPFLTWGLLFTSLGPYLTRYSRFFWNLPRYQRVVVEVLARPAAAAGEL